MDLRHEWKHRIAPGDLPILRARLGTVLAPDPYAVGGSYHIRSLYFDTPADTALREKLDGVNVREKFRIRCYNKDFSLIHLEKKWKANGLGTKEKAKLTPDQVRAILTGDWDWMPRSQDALIRELYVKMTLQGLRPKTIVDYTREPFVFGPGNVRVTLDYDLRTGLHCTDFLNPDCLTIPATDDAVILEVKWDQFLPDVIRDLVQIPGRRTAAFSKYAACRALD
ncbi:MAG: polyphosphate polymerase domain-containing protein [Ruminiclostridium sp.]|nr:polyphosphate polymerase domain-containing protein [Ruminiclostridium sp.]